MIDDAIMDWIFVKIERFKNKCDYIDQDITF